MTDEPFFLEIPCGLDSEDIAHLAEELALNPLEVATRAQSNWARLEDAAHYAAMNALRDVLTA